MSLCFEDLEKRCLMAVNAPCCGRVPVLMELFQSCNISTARLTFCSSRDLTPLYNLWFCFYTGSPIFDKEVRERTFHAMRSVGEENEGRRE